MRTVYEPANGVEAHLLQDYLKQEGIAAKIHGASLLGAVGELPGSGLVRLVVSDADRERALDAIRRWEMARPDDDDTDAQDDTVLRERPRAFWIVCVALVVGLAIVAAYFRLPFR